MDKYNEEADELNNRRYHAMRGDLPEPEVTGLKQKIDEHNSSKP